MEQKSVAIWIYILHGFTTMLGICSNEDITFWSKWYCTKVSVKKVPPKGETSKYAQAQGLPDSPPRARTF